MKKLIILACLSFCFFSHAQLSDIDVIYSKVQQVLSEVQKSDMTVEGSIRFIRQETKLLDGLFALSEETFAELVLKYPDMQHAFHASEVENEYYFEEQEARFVNEYYPSPEKYVLKKLFNLSTETVSSDHLSLSDSMFHGYLLRSSMDADVKTYKQISKGRVLNNLKAIARSTPSLIVKGTPLFLEAALASVQVPFMTTAGGVIAGLVVSPWFSEAPIYLGTAGLFTGVGLYILGAGAAAYQGISDGVSSLRSSSLNFLRKNLAKYKIGKPSNSTLDQILKIAGNHRLKTELNDSEIKIVSEGNFEIVITADTDGKMTSLSNTKLVYEIRLAEKSYKELKPALDKIAKSFVDVLSVDRCSLNYIK